MKVCLLTYIRQMAPRTSSRHNAKARTGTGGGAVTSGALHRTPPVGGKAVQGRVAESIETNEAGEGRGERRGPSPRNHHAVEGVKHHQ